MTPGIYNFRSYKRGDTFKARTFQIVVGPTIDGPFTPVDFTDAVAKLQLRKGPSAPVALEWKSEDDSLTLDADGYVTMNEKTGEEMQIDPFTYRYDLQVTLANGDTNTYMEGTFPIIIDYSR